MRFQSRELGVKCLADLQPWYDLKSPLRLALVARMLSVARHCDFARTGNGSPAKPIAVVTEPPRRRTTVPRQTHGRHGKHPSELVLRL